LLETITTTKIDKTTSLGIWRKEEPCSRKVF